MKRDQLTLLALAGAALLAIALTVPVSAAVPPPFWKKCETGKAAGQCRIPTGIAVDPDSGHLYIADVGNDRIDELTAWGVFVRAWGWDVVASGPGDDTGAPEDQFEVCVPAEGDVCKAGTSGGGPGQLASPHALTVDSSGDVYVVEGEYGVYSRVQKFDPFAGPSAQDVRFVLMFGGAVNETKVEEGAPESEQNRCPIAPGDICQAASKGRGKGQLEAFVHVGDVLATSPGTPETIYVGDKERIQEFETDGTYTGQIEGGVLSGETVDSLAVDPAGDLYVAFYNEANYSLALSKPNVHKLSPTGSPVCAIEVKNPTAITSDSTGGVYVVSSKIFESEAPPTVVRQFTSSCADKGEPFGPMETFGEFRGLVEPRGIAISVSCGVEGISVYVSNPDNADSYVRAYGNPPDPTICPPPKLPPDVNAQYAASVGTENAVLKAEINPHFWEDTTYYVEYGTTKCSEGGCVAYPSPPGSILKGAGADEDVTSSGVILAELEPATTYHYRFIAQSSGGGPTVGAEGSFTTFPPPAQPKADCPNQDFRVGDSAPLSDCRAYEMVSPVDKNNGDIFSFGRGTSPNYPTGLEQSSLDGERIAYSSATAFGDALSAPYASQYIASRSGQGWSTHGISPPRGSPSIGASGNVKFEGEYKAFSPDLCQAWLQHDTDPILGLGAVPGYLNLYRRDNCGTEGYEAITTVKPPSVDASNFESEVQGFSGDGAHTFFTSRDRLTADAPNIAQAQLYEATGGELRYVCVLPNGTPSGQACSVGTLNTPLQDGRENSVARAISADGSRVFWTSYIGNTGPGRLYLRTHPDQEQSAIEGGECTEADRACTVAISTGNGQFWTASTDGSTAIFSEGTKLFAYSVEAEEKTLIAEGLVGVAGASDDGSRVYFASSKAIAESGQNSEGDVAEAGKPNLYLYEAGEGTFAFIGTLSAEEAQGATSSAPRGFSPLTPISANPMRHASRVSPDGAHFAFTSIASLTGYDNTDVESGRADAEVFIYEAASKELACVSCNSSGARPKGREFFIVGEGTGFWAAAQIPTWENQLYAPRVLSEDGSRLFFESYEALVPRDTNGKQDVYEWERANGEGQCREFGTDLFVSSAGGCLSLISSGLSPTDSEFADASPDGRDVFFRTAASLLPQDPGLIDLYDAREGGGFPAAEVQASCEGEACQGPLTPPNDPTPASSAFEGAGNVTDTPIRCAKAKVRRKGRCVAKKHKQRARAKHRANDKRRAGR